MSSAEVTADKCPVDHNTRQAWLDKAREANAAKAAAAAAATSPSAPSSPPQPQPKTKVTPAHPNVSILAPSRFSLDLGREVPVHTPSQRNRPPLVQRRGGLGTDREISTIPRAQQILNDGREPPGTHAPANYEQDTGADGKSGNWIYPSEQMFFEAMKRKNFDPNTDDMKSIVPIHNAVNEQAWVEIKKWEAGRGAESCGGPKLVSFRGDSAAMTPKARMNNLLGYTKPFDRHDWVIDRCGTQIDYVIDFYAGKNDPRSGKALSFYLDVRPKLNTLEGWKMRAGHVLGL